MPLDSLGLGLTLDTTLLEKADKTLENMHKNSKLIMQNLTRGFTSFNSGGADALTKMSTALGHVSDALTKIDNAKVSPDFDTKGQEKYINRMQQLLDIVEKMSKISGAKFYDPTEVYATDKDASDIFAEIEELKEYKDELKELIDTVNNYGEVQSELSKKAREQKEAISKQEEEVKKLAKTYKEAEAKFNSSMEALSKFRDEFFDSKRKKKPSLTDEEIQEMYSSSKSKTKSALLKQLEDERVAINEAMKSLDNAYKDLAKKREALNKTTTEYKENRDAKNNIERIKIEYNNLREREKILRAELKFAQATQAERAAMLTKKNEAEIKADQKRIRDVQKSYEQLRKEIQKGEKDIADLEASRQTLKEANRPTKGIDNEIKRRRNELNKLMQDELEFRSSQYWPKLQAIDEKFNSEAFVKNQKALAKLAAKESRKDVTSAIQYSRNAQTINEEKEAIKRLVEARDNLSTSTARYKKTVEDINKRILAHKDHIEAVTRVEKEQNTLADSVINRYRKQLKALDEVNEALEKQMKIERKTSVADLDPTNADTQALLARQKTIAADIANIESRAQGELDVIKEQHEAERAKKRIEETLRQNEREKQEYAKLLDEKYALEKQKKAMEDAGAKKGNKAYDNILQQEQDLNNQISQLKAKHQKDLDEIDKKYAKKRNDDDVKAFIEAQKEKQKKAEEMHKQLVAYYEKYGTTSKKNAETAITSYSGAQNINQHKQAIEGLQKVRARLDNTDKDYYETLKKLNREIHSHELFIRAAENESVRLGNSHRGLMDISGQLMRRLALVFSVSQITQYFRKLVEVRGQFEKTEVALTSIVGSQEKSNKLMNQTIALAIKSPFTLQQLTGYTKQLAAYQVAYEQLHDTTKMLADVSAGLGVEMDRLILAFGQVKAANYLRATEVRQFTEAGFNILGELAKYYSELEGTMVSVGDVQERVTKRMVDFADVEEIFHRVTAAGGMFYEMQSKQAETLAGQWTNLQDRIDIMLNEIGTDKENILKFFVKFLASAIDNWEVLASSIKTAAAAFLIFKTYSLLAGDGMKLLAIQMGVLTNSVPKVLSLGQAFKTLSKVVGSAVTKIGTAMSSLLTNPIFLAIAAIGALIGAGISLWKHFDKTRDALKEQSDAFNEYTASLNKLSNEYNKLDKFTEKLAKLEELKSRLNERGLNLSVKIDEVNTDNIDEIFTENSEILQKSYDLGLSVGKSITRGINAAQGNIFGWSTFGENLAEDAEDFAAKWNKLASYGMDAQMTAMTNEIEATIAAMNNMTEEEKSAYAEMLKIYEEIKDGRKAEKDDKGKIIKYTESEYEWTIRRANALKQIQDLEDGSVTKNNRLARYIRQVTRQERELNHEVDNTINKLAKEFDGIGNLMQAAKDNPVEFSAAIQAEVDKQAWDEVTKWVYSQKLHARLDITPNYVEDPNAEDAKKLAQFQQDLVDARANLEKKGKGYQNFFISKEEIEQMKFFSDGIEGIQKLYDENKKTIEQLDGTAGDYNKEELARLNALQKALEDVAKKWGYDLDKDKGAKGKDEKLERLKNQISLIKEMNKEYEKLNKTFSKAESLAKVQKAYADTAKELGLDTSTMDFTDEGTIKSLEALLGKPEYAANQYVIELQKALDNFEVELGITTKQEDDERLKNDIQKLFDQYDLTLELKKLNIPPELAKSLFDVDYLDLNGLKRAVQAQSAKFIGTDMEKDYENFLKKIDEMERKALVERTKTYLEYAKLAIGERAKIKLEELQKLKEIEETFAIKEGDSKETQAYKKDMRERASSRVKQEAEAALKNLEWDEFQKTETFTSLFADIDDASDALINHMIKKIREFKDEWKDMPLEDVRTMVNKLNELEGALAERSPWEAYRKAQEAVKKARKDAMYSFESDEARNLYGKGKSNKDYIAAIQIENAYQEEKAVNAEKEVAAIESILALKTKEREGSVVNLGLTRDQMEYTKLTEKELRDLLKTKKGEASTARAIVLSNGQVLVQYKNQEKSLLKQKETLGEVQNMANDLYEAFTELAEALGADSESPAAIFADMGMNMMNAVLNTMMLQAQLKAVEVGAYAAGTALNTAMGVIGWIVMGVQLLAAGITAIAKINDNRIVAQLEEQAAIIEKQREEYEKIEKKVESAYNVDNLREYNAEMKRSVELEIQALEASIALEKSRKNVDEEQVKDYEMQIDEARERLAESTQGMMEELGGIFDFSDFTSGFVDAWWDAMDEGMSGLDALSDHFEETMKDMVKKQALYRGAQEIMKQVQDTINKSLEGDYSIDEGEWQAIMDAAKKANVNLDAFLQGWYDMFGAMSEGTSSGLSGLQKGIQGITEDTAQIIESYLNSVRGYVSEQVTYTKKIYNLLFGATTTSGSIKVVM